MTDLRTAAQQALEDLKDLHKNHNITYAGTISRLEAALAQQQANPPGCDHCNHPLYAATKCRVCGRVTEPKAQEPTPPPEARTEAEKTAYAAGWWDALRKAQQAEPARSQQMADAGFKPRDRRLECDECGGKFTAQMLPIHKCAQRAEPVQEPVAWRWGYRSVTTGEMDWRGYVEIAAHPNLRSPEIIMEPLYTAPPQRKPLSADKTMALANETAGANWGDEAHLQRFRAAIERAHGIEEKK